VGAEIGIIVLARDAKRAADLNRPELPLVDETMHGAKMTPEQLRDLYHRE
jgi:hypothetical protein